MHQTFLVIGAGNRREQTLKLFDSFKSKFTTSSPDISIIVPIKNVTGIDLVRQVKGHINQRPVSLPFKFIIFENAHTLNKEAQNALLKTLEEPPATAIIILEGHDKSLFLPTILSRVAIVWAKEEQQNKKEEETEFTQESFLENIASVENPKEWLDSQMVRLYQKLQNNLSQKNTSDAAKLTKAIENYKEAKKMIDANVNPKFVLANIALSN